MNGVTEQPLANAIAPPAIAEPTAWPRFSDIAEPEMVCLFVGNGSASKPYQSFLDGHPNILMLPAYPLLYFYPHWEQWRDELGDGFDWPAIIDAFCANHASVLDSRLIPGFNGLTQLGESQDEIIAIDTDLFRAGLLHMLQGEPVRSRTFLLAVHYAWGICYGENLRQKTVLLYHIHVPEYVARYLKPDFPDMLTIGMVRDPRANIGGRYKSSYAAVDAHRLDRSDAIIYMYRAYYFTCELLFESLPWLDGFDLSRTRVVRAEDLHYRLDDLLRRSLAFMGLSVDDSTERMTFGGKLWWGDSIYDMKPMNEFNPRVVSDNWKKTLAPMDWFVLEGLFTDYFERYGYTAEKFDSSNGWHRFLLRVCLALPSSYERAVFVGYVNPAVISDFVRSSWREATGAEPLKPYAGHAFYRHKITTRDLMLWKERWHKRLVMRCLDRHDRETGGFSSRAVVFSIAVLYTVVNLGRYGIAMGNAARTYVRRVNMFRRALARQTRRTNSYPDPI